MTESNDSHATSPPQDSDLIQVLAAVIVRNSRYLVCKRPMTKRHDGLWEFPGGKLEREETWIHAARREIKEELGLAVDSVGEPVFSVRDDKSPFVITFVPVEVEGEPQALEHDELRWLPLSDLEALKLAPSDRCFANWLAQSALL